LIQTKDQLTPNFQRRTSYALTQAQTKAPTNITAIKTFAWESVESRNLLLDESQWAIMAFAPIFITRHFPTNLCPFPRTIANQRIKPHTFQMDFQWVTQDRGDE
jgi:hypothetical protein